MVTDEMMRHAAGEVELAMLAVLSAKDIAPHKFSDRFEKKMKKLINKVKHPIRYNVLRSAAAIILIIFTIFGSLMVFSPEVRASVTGWFKETFFEFFQYSSSGDAESAEYDYHFETIPDSYKELQVIDSKDGKTYLYVNDTGSILQFAYAYGGRADNLFVKTESYTQFEGAVNGISADIYISSNENEANVIIWQDPDTETLLCIHAKAEDELLIKLAEAVIKMPKENS